MNLQGVPENMRLNPDILGLKIDCTVDWRNLEIVLHTLVVLSCPNKLTGIYRTVSTFVPCSSEFTRLIYEPKWQDTCALMNKLGLVLRI